MNKIDWKKEYEGGWTLTREESFDYVNDVINEIPQEFYIGYIKGFCSIHEGKVV